MACILMNPGVQVKAQKEIDQQIGRERLPNFNDRELLPYTECIMKEIMRSVYVLYYA